MSMTSFRSKDTSLKARFQRPLPPGQLNPAERGGVPHAWVPLDSSTWGRLVMWIDQIALWAVLSSGSPLTDGRTFLGQVGRFTAFVGAVATGLLGPLGERQAGAIGSCSSPCGPSKLCLNSNCFTTANCKTSVSGVYRRGPYESLTCSTQAVSNCWIENYCNGCAGTYGNKAWSCCDCCQPSNAGSGLCTSASGCSVYRCICRTIWNPSC